MYTNQPDKEWCLLKRETDGSGKGTGMRCETSRAPAVNSSLVPSNRHFNPDTLHILSSCRPAQQATDAPTPQI